MAEDRTLDLKEPQIIRHYPQDQDAFYWHHRLLLEKCSPGIWIALTPDGDLERLDLNTVPHIVLDRNAAFPAAQAPFVYAFDDMSRNELEGHKRRARVMTNLFNDSTVEAVGSFEWLVADVSREDFGEKVEDRLVTEGVTLRDSALVEIDGEVVHVIQVNSACKDDWMKSKEDSKGDSRLLGNYTDGQGRRFLDFGEGIDLMTEPSFNDWPLSGPRACLEYLKSVRSGCSDLITYHLQWAKNSGISQYAAGLYEHRTICDSLKYFIQVDQIDPSAMLGAELLVRRLIQIETAVSRNPASPDFSGLDVIMETGVGMSGEAQAQKFQEWIGSKLKEKAQVQKQSRLYKEEFGRQNRLDGGGGGPTDAKGRGKGRGRAKQKARGSEASAASGGQ